MAELFRVPQSLLGPGWNVFRLPARTQSERRNAADFQHDRRASDRSARTPEQLEPEGAA